MKKEEEEVRNKKLEEWRNGEVHTKCNNIQLVHNTNSQTLIEISEREIDKRERGKGFENKAEWNKMRDSEMPHNEAKTRVNVAE